MGGVANGLGGPTVTALFKARIPEERQGMAFGAPAVGGLAGFAGRGAGAAADRHPAGLALGVRGCAVLVLATVALAPRDVPAPPPGTRAAQARRRSPPSTASRWRPRWPAPPGVGMVSFLVTYSVENGIGETAAGLLLGAVSLTAAARPDRARVAARPLRRATR